MVIYNSNKLNKNIEKIDAQYFRKKLDDSNYKFIYNSLLGSYISNDAWICERNLSLEKLKNFCKEDVFLFRYLLLGTPIKTDIFKEKMGLESLAFLKKINFTLEKEEELYTNGYSIIPIKEMFLIVSTPSEYKSINGSIIDNKFVDIYIGQDSFSMMNMISNRRFDRVLDLCAGSGVQGFNFLLNNYDSSLTSVELNENAYNSIFINSYMNNFKNNIEVICSDLYDELSNKKYDCILSNPPYVPAPKNIPLPMCGDGGEDGFLIAEKIIKGYSKHLEKNGYAYMVLECIGNDEKPYIIDIFERYLKKGTLNLRILTTFPIELQAQYSADLISYLSDIEEKKELYNKFLGNFKKYNASKMYSVVLEYINDERDFSINKIILEDIPFNKPYKFNNFVKVEESQVQFTNFLVNGTSVLSLNKKMYEKIRKSDSLNDILNNEEIREYNNFIRTIDLLKENNIIYFVENDG